MARPTLGETASERLHMMITAAEINAIDDWRRIHGVKSKSEAVRQLVRAGLAAMNGQGDTDQIGGDA